MKLKSFLAVAALSALPAVHAFAAERPVVVAGSVPVSKAQLDRGRYLVQLGGCNDCHTEGYAERGGQVPEEQWLLGTSLAYEGPWGTSFPTNLRLTMLRYNDEEWLDHAHSLAARPPMPWFTLQRMSDDDLVAVLRFVQWLGPKGEPAPQPLLPGEKWLGPVVQFTVNAP